MYRCETWTIEEAERKKLETFEMVFYRRMLKIKGVDRITNEKVHEKVREKRTM